VSIEGILWPLALGIYLGLLLLLAALVLFVAIVLVAQPFLAVVGIRRAIRQYLAEKAQSALRSALSRTRSE
jgi:hypothetical protein